MKLIPFILFGVSMLSLGIAILVFPNEIRVVISKCIGDRKWIDTLNSVEAIWSFRFGGLMGILIGVFTLFMCIRNIFSQ